MSPLPPAARPASAPPALVTALLALSLSLWPAAAAAQDDEFEFGEEEFDEGAGGGKPGGKGDDEEMTFESDEESPAPAAGKKDDGMTFEGDDAGALPRTVVLVIHSPGAEPELAQRLTDALEKYVQAIGRYEVVESDEFRAQLFGPGEAAAMDCATNAVCLSGYGKDLWIDSILIGVLYRGAGGWKTECNKIDVDRAEVESYASHDDTALDRRVGRDLDEIAAGMGARLLGLTQKGAGEDRPRTRVIHERGPIQTRLAWGTAGLSAVAMAAAAVLGFEARSKESKVKADDLTQVAAPALIDEGKTKARNANIFLGLSVAVAAGSAALFFIKPQQEVEIAPTGPTPGFQDEPDAGLSPLLPEWGVAGAGVSATWRLP